MADNKMTEIIDYLGNRKTQYPPTVREIAATIGVSVSITHHMLTVLRQTRLYHLGALLPPHHKAGEKLMMMQPVNQGVDVIAMFRGNKVSPLIFEYNTIKRIGCSGL